MRNVSTFKAHGVQRESAGWPSCAGARWSCCSKLRSWSVIWSSDIKWGQQADWCGVCSDAAILYNCGGEKDNQQQHGWLSVSQQSNPPLCSWTLHTVGTEGGNSFMGLGRMSTGCLEKVWCSALKWDIASVQSFRFLPLEVFWEKILRQTQNILEGLNSTSWIYKASENRLWNEFLQVLRNKTALWLYLEVNECSLVSIKALKSSNCLFKGGLLSFDS